jgi:mRNA interferase MazF
MRGAANTRRSKRAVLVMQDDAFNRSRIGTVVVVPLTTNLALAEAPGNVLLGKRESGLSRDSVIVVSQVGAIDKRRLVESATRLRKGTITNVESGIRLVLGLKS